MNDDDRDERPMSEDERAMEVEARRRDHALDALLDLHPTVEPSPGFADRVVERAMEGDETDSRTPGVSFGPGRWWRRGAIAASVGLIALVVWSAVDRDRPGGAANDPASMPEPSVVDYGILVDGEGASPVDALEDALEESEWVESEFLPLG